MYMRSFIVTAAFTALMCAAGNVAQAAAPQASEFVRNASIGNMFEIESSKLAINRASAQNVKDFAQMMVADHTEVGNKLKEALGQSGKDITPASDLDDKHQKMLNELKVASTPAFDNQYVQAQSKAHDEAVKLFSDYAEDGDDANLKKFASDTLPTLKKHQDEVHTLNQAYMSTKQERLRD
jgi:putative membrane protein